MSEHPLPPPANETGSPTSEAAHTLPAARPARRVWRRPALLALGGLAVLAAMVGTAEWAGWPFLRGPLQQQLQDRLNAPVSLVAPFRLHLIVNPGVQVAQARLGAPEGLGVPHLLDAQALDLRWRWADLLRHREGTPWLLKRVAAERLDLRLVRLADGRASWPAPPPRPMGQAALPRLRDLPLNVETIGLSAADVLYRDALTATDLQAEIHTDAADQGPQALRAAVHGLWRNKPVQVRATVGGVSALFDSDAATAMVPVWMAGRIGGTELSFRGVAADVLSARALQGSLLVRGASLAAAGDALGITLPSTPPFRLATALTHDGGLWTVRTTRAQVGGSRLQAELVYDGRLAIPRLTGRLGGEVLRLKDLGPAIGTPSPSDVPALGTVLDVPLDDVPGARPPATASGTAAAPRPDRVMPDRRFDLPTLRVMNADVQVAIDTLDLGDDAVIEPLRQLSTHLTLQNGVLTLDTLRARAAGGQVQGRTQLDASAVESPARWLADLRFTGLKVEDWLRALQREGRPLVAGRLAAQVQVRGVGRSTAELMSTLQGQAAARLDKGTISHLLLEVAGLDVAQALGVLVRGDRALVLSCFDVQTHIDQGVMRVTHAVADTSDSTLRIGGQVDLGEETLALRAVAKPKDFSPFSLRTPVLVGGTLKSPALGIEGSRLAPRLAAAAALALVAGPAGLLPFLEFGTEAPQGPDPCQPVR